MGVALFVGFSYQRTEDPKDTNNNQQNLVVAIEPDISRKAQVKGEKIGANNNRQIDDVEER
jgi:hypothetical protein